MKGNKIEGKSFFAFLLLEHPAEKISKNTRKSPRRGIKILFQSARNRNERKSSKICFRLSSANGFNVSFTIDGKFLFSCILCYFLLEFFFAFS